MARGATLDNDKSSTGQAYEIIKADNNLTALEVDGKKLRFPRVNNSMMRIKDRGLAMSIRDKYGGGRSPAVTVTKVAYPDIRDRGHKYFFQVPEMPWKRSNGNGKAENEEKETAEREGNDEFRRGDRVAFSPDDEKEKEAR
jgi:hypothetical protein